MSDRHWHSPVEWDVSPEFTIAIIYAEAHACVPIWPIGNYNGYNNSIDRYLPAPVQLSHWIQRPEILPSFNIGEHHAKEKDGHIQSNVAEFINEVLLWSFIQVVGRLRNEDEHASEEIYPESASVLDGGLGDQVDEESGEELDAHGPGGRGPGVIAVPRGEKLAFQEISKAAILYFLISVLTKPVHFRKQIVKRDYHQIWKHQPQISAKRAACNARFSSCLEKVQRKHKPW